MLNPHEADHRDPCRRCTPQSTCCAGQAITTRRGHHRAQRLLSLLPRLEWTRRLPRARLRTLRRSATIAEQRLGCSRQAAGQRSGRRALQRIDGRVRTQTMRNLQPRLRNHDESSPPHVISPTFQSAADRDVVQDETRGQKNLVSSASEARRKGLAADQLPERYHSAPLPTRNVGASLCQLRRTSTGHRRDRRTALQLPRPTSTTGCFQRSSIV
jgi:hypothetical protein